MCRYFTFNLGSDVSEFFLETLCKSCNLLSRACFHFCSVSVEADEAWHQAHHEARMKLRRCVFLITTRCALYLVFGAFASDNCSVLSADCKSPRQSIFSFVPRNAAQQDNLDEPDDPALIPKAAPRFDNSNPWPNLLTLTIANSKYLCGRQRECYEGVRPYLLTTRHPIRTPRTQCSYSSIG